MGITSDKIECPKCGADRVEDFIPVTSNLPGIEEYNCLNCGRSFRAIKYILTLEVIPASANESKQKGQ